MTKQDDLRALLQNLLADKPAKRRRRKGKPSTTTRAIPEAMPSVALPPVDFGPQTNVVAIKPKKKLPRLRDVVARAKTGRTTRKLDDRIPITANLSPFTAYKPPPGVLPPGMAMDEVVSAQSQQIIQWAAPVGTFFREGLVFPGYAYLAELTLRPEYRVFSSVIATEMTRKWIKFKSTVEKKAEDVTEGFNEEEPVEGEEPFGAGGAGGIEGEKDDDDADVAEGAEEEADLKDAPRDDEHDDDETFASDAEPGEGSEDPQNKLVELQAAQHEQKMAQHEEGLAESEERAAQMAAVDDKGEKIKELEAEFKRLCVQDVFFKLIEMDGWFGRIHLYLDMQDPGSQQSYTDNPDELQTDVGDGQDEVTKAKVTKGSLKRLAVIEPVWTYPQRYDSKDPLKPEFYNPSVWFVMGKQVHASRLLTYISKPVPDILKPAYGFGGLSLSQLARPYVDNWLQTRQSVNDIIHAFSVMVLLTDLFSTTQASDGTGNPNDGSDLMDRVDLFNSLRDNRGTFVIDKEGEDFKNVTVPLSNLDSLQAQAQEHMASVTRIPLVKLLGISPHGLNATAEPELHAFYETIHAEQEAKVRPPLTKVMHFAMINLWGEIDEEIDFDFEQLQELNPKEEAERRKLEAETDDILINGCNALHPEETRKRLANEADSPYDDIDLADVPKPPAPDSPINIHGTQPFGKGAQAEGQEDPQGEPGQSPGKPGQSDREAERGGPFGDSARVTGDSAVYDPIARAAPPGNRISIDAQGFLRVEKNSYGFDAEWHESDHPRVKGGPHAGEFGQGSGSSSSSAPASAPGPSSKSQSVASGGPGQYAGMYETKGANPKENHALTVSKVLAKPAQKGIHYRRLLAALIKEAPGFAGSSAVNPLKQKLGEALGMTFASLQKAGKTEEAAKVAKQAAKLATGFLGEGFAKGQAAGFAAPSASPKKPVTPQLPPPSVATVATSPGPAAQAKPITSAAPQASPSDLEKAKKPSPFYPAPTSAEGKALVKPFNEKYEGKNITDPGQLNQKVADYKAVSKELEKIALKEQAAKEAAAKAAAKAEMDKLAGTPEDKAHYAVLASITGGASAANSYISHAQNMLQNAGLVDVLSAAEAASIVAYSGSHYGPVNAQLRKGMVTEEQFLYAKNLDTALKKMPAHKGVTYRKASLPDEEAAKYKPGYIVWERAFTSSSKKQGTWSGSHHYVITGKSGRDIQKLSSHSGEAEVLFPMNTHFKVTKREGNTIHLEEM